VPEPRATLQGTRWRLAALASEHCTPTETRCMTPLLLFSAKVKLGFENMD
jgi:hypothetical protein